MKIFPTIISLEYLNFCLELCLLHGVEKLNILRTSDISFRRSTHVTLVVINEGVEYLIGRLCVL